MLGHLVQNIAMVTALALEAFLLEARSRRCAGSVLAFAFVRLTRGPVYRLGSLGSSIWILPLPMGSMVARGTLVEIADTPSSSWHSINLPHVSGVGVRHLKPETCYGREGGSVTPLKGILTDTRGEGEENFK